MRFESKEALGDLDGDGETDRVRITVADAQTRPRLSRGANLELLGRSGRLYHDRSFGYAPTEQPRAGAIFLCESISFDRLVMLVILCNCVLMALDSPRGGLSPQM